MLPQERYPLILKLFETKNVVRLEDLTVAFNISVETARRDFTFLEKQGLIKKIYGGATLAGNKVNREMLFADKLGKNRTEKELIGQRCNELIHDGDTVFLEVGTTVLQVAKAIRHRQNLTIITNSIFVINELIGSKLNLYVSGGQLRHNEQAISGSIAISELAHFNINKAVISAGAISVENGLSDYSLDEARMRRKLIERANQSILVVDSSKFGEDATFQVCPLSEISTIITGKTIDENTLTELKKTCSDIQLV